MLRAYNPQNIEKNGGVFGGIFQLRNVIEAGIWIFICWFIIFVICNGLITDIIKLLLMSIIGGMGALLCVVGIKGENVSDFLLNMYAFKENRKIVLFRVPRPIKNEEPKKATLFNKIGRKKGE